MAFYPIFLIIITYACIKLHDNNFRPVVWLWKPFHRHFVHFRRSWDSKASIINAFTTFLLLSFSKILFVSYTLLYTFRVQYNYGDIPSKCVLYYDPTVECHSSEYFIFAAVAVCVLAIFEFIPTILLIAYPTKLFRRCVSCCGFRRGHALHMFVESFQGEYKDGTNGTRDFRMVSASFLVLRILTMTSYLATVCFFHKHSLAAISAGVQCIMFAVASSFYAIMRPYKLNYMSNVDYLILTLLEIVSFEVLFSAFHTATEDWMRQTLVTTILLCTPHIVLIFYICYVLAKKVGITQCLKKKYETVKSCVKATRQAETNVDTESDAGSLPDRLINPGEYEPMILTTEEHTSTDIENRDQINEEPRRLTPVYTYGSIN